MSGVLAGAVLCLALLALFAGCLAAIWRIRIHLPQIRSPFSRLLAAITLAAFVAVGGGKTNSPPNRLVGNIATRLLGGATNVFPFGFATWPFDGITANVVSNMPATVLPPIPDAMLASGLALQRVSAAQGDHAAAIPSNAVAVAQWLPFDADNRAVSATLPFDFPFGTNAFGRAAVFSNGRISFGTPTLHRRPPDGLQASAIPFADEPTIAPAWGNTVLAAATGASVSVATNSASFTVLWRNALNPDAPGATNSLVACTLDRHGGVSLRYAASDATFFTNLSVGAAAGTNAAWALAESVPSWLGGATNAAFEATLVRVGADGWADADDDSDGLSNFEEFLIGTSPDRPDTDEDGVPDGWRRIDYDSLPFWPTACEDPDVVISLAQDLPDGDFAVLNVNDVPVVLCAATNLALRCAKGEMLTFSLGGHSRHPAEVSLSVTVNGKGRAYRLEDSGLFSSPGLRSLPPKPPAASVVFPRLTLLLDDDAALTFGDCLHSGVDSVHYSLEVQPASCTNILANVISYGFEEGSSYTLEVPSTAVDRATAAQGGVYIDGGWLTDGSEEDSVSLHHAQYFHACESCGGMHPPCECPGTPEYETPDDAGATNSFGLFMRIGATNCVSEAWNLGECLCCGHMNATSFLFQVESSSQNVSAWVEEETMLFATGTGASSRFGADYVKYTATNPVNSSNHTGVVRYTLADIRLRFDYDGDGAISQEERDRAAGAQLPGGAQAWAIPHGEEPFLCEFTVNACSNFVVSAGVDGFGNRLFADSSCSSNALDSVANALARDGATSLWLLTTNAHSSASLSLSLGLDGSDVPLIAEAIPLAVRSMELPEFWLMREDDSLEYDYPSISNAPQWRLVSNATSNTIQTGAGNTFTVSPSSLAVGDYTVAVLDPDLEREGFAYNTATGRLHIVETALSTNAITIVRNATAGSAIGRQRLALAAGSTQTAGWTISPAESGGAHLYAAATGGEPLTVVTNAAEVWIGPGGIDRAYTVTATHPQCPLSSDSATVAVISAFVVPDYDFDGVIDSADEGHLATNRAFTMWLNNDNDDAAGFNDLDGSEGGAGLEVPEYGYLYADWSDTKVNGTRDLIDWFPICIKSEALLSAFPPSEGYAYRLAQEGNALSFIWTSLRHYEAGAFLFDDTPCTGIGFLQPVTNAVVARMSGASLDIPEDFLSQTGHDRVCLVEGRYATAAPLAVEVMQGSELVARIEMPLRVTTVEDMFRFSNIRPLVGGSASPQSRTNAPPCRPYIPNGKTVFMVHGFRVGANESRGWGSEFFKKLLRSGSRADFWMVTWRSDEGTVADYYLNVENAFKTAPYLASLVNSVQGEKIILAHSLGNMVVSSAIQDYGMSVGKYFALNSAVASEAYDATLFDVATNNPLVHSEWVEYTNTSWSANYHGFFSAPDDRSRLTWRGRFADVPMLTDMYNFYSSGDEVLEIGPQGITVLDWDASVRQYTWHKQEAFKGRNVLYGTGWAGWGFESNVTAQAANAAAPATLRDSPIFEHDPAEMFSANISTNMQNSILAKGIPALSKAVGMSTWAPSGGQCIHIFNMNDLTSQCWPRPPADNSHKWLHSDIQNLSLFFTYGVFSEVVDKGGLDE